jgi:hypothetical protein
MIRDWPIHCAVRVRSKDLRDPIGAQSSATCWADLALDRVVRSACTGMHSKLSCLANLKCRNHHVSSGRDYPATPGDIISESCASRITRAASSECTGMSAVTATLSGKRTRHRRHQNGILTLLVSIGLRGFVLLIRSSGLDARIARSRSES